MLFGTWETLLRRAHYRPAITDSPALWSFERYRGHLSGDHTIWFLGKSRIFNAIDPSVLRSSVPEYTGVQLAVPGTSAVATLLDMAQTPSERGVVVCSVTAHELSAFSHDDQAEYVEAFRGKAHLNDMLNAVIGAAAQDRIVTLAATSHLRTFASELLRYHRLPAQWHARQRFVRWRAADFFAPGVDLSAVRNRSYRNWTARLQRQPPPAPSSWLAGLQPVLEAVRTLKRRGVRVVFIRMPTTGRWWAFDQRTYPRTRYWDRFAETVDAPTIHFQDEPLLRTFRCPDDSHIDVHDRPRFTRALLAILRRNGILPAPPPVGASLADRPKSTAD